MMLFQLLFPTLIVFLYIIGISNFSQEYNSNELTTLIFTASVFYVTFYLEKMKDKMKNILFPLCLILLHIFIFIFFTLKGKPTPNYFLLIFGFSLYILWEVSNKKIINKLKKCITNYFTKKLKNEKNSNIFKIYIKYIFSKQYKNRELKEKKLKLTIDTNNDIYVWLKIIQNFSNHHKRESTNLAKKNKLTEKFHIEYEAPSLINILDIEHKIKILYTFLEAILNIEKDEQEFYD